MNKREVENRLTPQLKLILDKALPYLREGRKDDEFHTYKMTEEILNFHSDKHEIDKDVFIPLAILHDIGHSVILPEHMKYVSGAYKLSNSKLIHMFAGAKIAKKILEEVKYNPKKIKEIVEIISMHDGYSIKEMGKTVYNTDNKKIFHDLDRLGLIEEERLVTLIKTLPKERIPEVHKKIFDLIDELFYDDIKKMAKERLKKLSSIFEVKT